VEPSTEFCLDRPKERELGIRDMDGLSLCEEEWVSLCTEECVRSSPAWRRTTGAGRGAKGGGEEEHAAMKVKVLNRLSQRRRGGCVGWVAIRKYCVGKLCCVMGCVLVCSQN